MLETEIDKTDCALCFAASCKQADFDQSCVQDNTFNSVRATKGDWGIALNQTTQWLHVRVYISISLNVLADHGDHKPQIGAFRIQEYFSSTWRTYSNITSNSSEILAPKLLREFARSQIYMDVSFRMWQDWNWHKYCTVSTIFYW